MPNSLALFGGTFDPIHQGHLQVAKAVQAQFQFEKFVFLPCKQPTHKNNSQATPKQRIEMLQLALKADPIPNAEISDEEINRTTPSYMIETLRAFKKRYGPNTPLTLILGTDAFLTLPTWHESEAIQALATLLVIERDPSLRGKAEAIQRPLKPLDCFGFAPQRQDTQKNILYFNAGHYPISSQQIRHNRQTGQSLQDLVPQAVQEYIVKYKLYQPTKN